MLIVQRRSLWEHMRGSQECCSPRLSPRREQRPWVPQKQLKHWELCFCSSSNLRYKEKHLNSKAYLRVIGSKCRWFLKGLQQSLELQNGFSKCYLCFLSISFQEQGSFLFWMPLISNFDETAPSLPMSEPTGTALQWPALEGTKAQLLCEACTAEQQQHVRALISRVNPTQKMSSFPHSDCTHNTAAPAYYLQGVTIEHQLYPFSTYNYTWSWYYTKAHHHHHTDHWQHPKYFKPILIIFFFN